MLVLLSMVSVNKCTMYGALHAQYKHATVHTLTKLPFCSHLQVDISGEHCDNDIHYLYGLTHTHTHTYNGYVHKYCIVQYTVHYN